VKGRRVVAAGGRCATCMGGWRSCAGAIGHGSTCLSCSRCGPHGTDAPSVRALQRRRHGARADRDCADTGRTQALKWLKHALPTAAHAEINGARWPFRKRPQALASAEGDRLARLFTDSPKSEAADHVREDLTDLFERDDTKAGATCAIRAWCTRVRQRGLTEFESFLGTIERWMHEITHDFQGRQTSGFVEGFNNRVTVLTRRCDGICHVGRLVQQLTPDLHGYQLSGHL
jgi:transposase